MGTGFSKRKKEAKMMQEQFGKMQQKMQSQEVVGTAGNGLVTLTLSGNHELKKISIKKECVDPEDIEGLEDLIKVAFNDATNKLNKSMEGMNLPGMNLPGLGSLGF